MQTVKHWTQSQKDNRNNLIHHLDRREASSRLHSVVAYSVSNKTWAKCPASFSSGFWSASIQKEPPPLSFDFVTHSASGFDFLEAVLHLFCSDQSVAKVLAECTRKAGGPPERPRMLQTLQYSLSISTSWSMDLWTWQLVLSEDQVSRKLSWQQLLAISRSYTEDDICLPILVTCCALLQRLTKQLLSLKAIFIHHTVPLDDHLQEAGPHFDNHKKGKMQFWDPSQWDKMCFKYQRIKYQWKNGKM